MQGHWNLWNRQSTSSRVEPGSEIKVGLKVQFKFGYLSRGQGTVHITRTKTVNYYPDFWRIAQHWFLPWFSKIKEPILTNNHDSQKNLKNSINHLQSCEFFTFFDENHWFLENQNWQLLDFEFFFKTTWTDDFPIQKYFKNQNHWLLTKIKLPHNTGEIPCEEGGKQTLFIEMKWGSPSRRICVVVGWETQLFTQTVLTGH
jgi:hypothetical protein